MLIQLYSTAPALPRASLSLARPKPVLIVVKGGAPEENGLLILAISDLLILKKNSIRTAYINIILCDVGCTDATVQVLL